MSGPEDASPQTIDGIIDLNISEESSLCEILRELEQRFPHEGTEALRRRTLEQLQAKAQAGAVGFFLRHWPAGTMEDITIQDAIERLHRPETWIAHQDNQLVAYETPA